MNIGGQSRRALVLLGAGASRGAYTGIGPAKIKPPLNRDFFDVAQRFARTRDGRRYRTASDRILRFIDNEMRLKAGETLTMEQVFNVLFISKDLPMIFRRTGRPRDVGFRREIVDFFSLVVGLLRFVQLNPRNPRNIDHHLALARALEDGDTVLSLNYDTLIDNALLTQGWDPRSGYGFPAHDKVTYSGLARGSGRPHDLLLLKPHGSLNWFARGSLQTYEDVLTRRRPSRIIMSPAPRAYDIARQSMVRFFIPPLYAKFFANTFWRRLWNHAFTRLTDARLLVIVGCSLIETDFHLRSVIGRALSRRRQQFDSIILVEQSPNVVGQLKRFLRGRSANGFETYPNFTDFVSRRLE